jgi:dihydropteroate synthase
MSTGAPYWRSSSSAPFWEQRGSGRSNTVTSEAMRRFRLGDRTHDVTNRTLVMGVLNRTPDSFFDRGATFQLDALLGRAEQLVAEGAEVLDVGGVKAGPGPEVSEAEELDRVIPTLEALRDRFDVPLSVDTWRAAVLRAACQAGAVVGNDISGFADPDYLPTAATHGVSVVATHIRLAPRVPDPEPHYDDVVGEVRAFLLARAAAARDAGLDPEQIAIDAGLDLGKTAVQSAILLRESDALAALGYTLMLSASNKRFLGDLLGLAIDDRGAASLVALAYGVMHGCRIVRVHEVAGSVRVCRMVEAITACARDGVQVS